MNYGGSNDVINSICPRCGKSPDTHKPVPFVSSGSVTSSLLSKLSSALKDNAVGVYLQGYQSAVKTSMMGAAVALIGTEKRQYLSLSGPGTDLFNHIDRRFIGNDIVLVSVPNGLDNLVIGAGGAIASGEFPNNPYARKQDSSVPKAFSVNRPPAQGNNRDYPLGTCAAIKLITRIYKDAAELGKDIQSIEMAEMLFFDLTSNGGNRNRDWQTGQIVMSCDTCKQVLPQILCNNISG